MTPTPAHVEARAILHGAETPDVVYLRSLSRSLDTFCTKDAPCGGCARIARALAERDQQAIAAQEALAEIADRLLVVWGRPADGRKLPRAAAPYPQSPSPKA